MDKAMDSQDIEQKEISKDLREEIERICNYTQDKYNKSDDIYNYIKNSYIFKIKNKSIINIYDLKYTTTIIKSINHKFNNNDLNYKIRIIELIFNKFENIYSINKNDPFNEYIF